MGGKEAIIRRERAILLFETYGSLLTKRQRETFSAYFLSDLSLAEVAEIGEVSRAAVSDSLAKTFHKLEEMEKRLGFIEKTERVRSLIEEAKETGMGKEELIRRMEQDGL